MVEAPATRLSRRWGLNVRDARLNRGLRQVDLAERVGQTQTTVGRYERGEVGWTPEVMLTFAVALDLTVAELFPWPTNIEEAERSRLQAGAA